MTPVLANILQPLVDFFEGILKFFHDTFGLGWGTSIVFLTLLVRAILLPVTYKSSKSMIRLQQLAPQMKAMQTKYKDDPQRQQQETMKFYRENSVNPFASCLPMVAQLPVFLSLYYMLRTDLRHDICPDVNPVGTANPVPCGESPESSFLFIPDLTEPRDRAAVLVVLIVLYVGSQLVSTLLMSATADKNQRLIFLALPFFFVAVIWQFPAGLLVYWITTNLWTIVQQSIIKKRLGPLREQAMAAAKAAKEEQDALKAKGGGGKSKSDGKGGGAPRALGRLSKPAEPESGNGKAKAARRTAAGAAAQEEEALGAAPVSASAAERVRELLEQVNEALALDATVEIEQPEDGVIRATLHADDLGLFIGRHGTTIDAVQHLAYRIAAAADDGPAARDRRRRRLPRAARGSAARARPTRPPRTRSAPAARSRWTR